MHTGSMVGNTSGIFRKYFPLLPAWRCGDSSTLACRSWVNETVWSPFIFVFDYKGEGLMWGAKPCALQQR